MKFIVTFFLSIAFSAQVFAQPSVPSADELLKPALAKAGRENKKVMLIFHASWCGWCRKMDASLQDATVKETINRNYEIVHLAVHETPNHKALENEGALAFLEKNGGKDRGLPYWFVLDKNGGILADSQYEAGKNTGCPASEEEVEYFIKVLKKTAAFKEEELQKIRFRFRKNEQ